MFMKLKKSEKSLQKPPFVSFIRSIIICLSVSRDGGKLNT
jgi:hypothetical protein